jgi:hypothetical protein
MLFGLGPPVTRATTHLCYAETCASLRRKLNRGVIDFASFATARSLLRNEVLLDPEFGLMSVGDDDVLVGVALTDQHNLNSTDAAILATYLRYARAQAAAAPICVLVAADRRLLRAANAEGLRGVDPEQVVAADVASTLGAL